MSRRGPSTMKQSFRIFYWGMLISFFGTLPPGIMNILGFQIYSNAGTGDALLYAAGFMLTEAFLVRITLYAMTWLVRSKSFFHIVEWITAAMLIVFSIVCFIAADSMRQNLSAKPGSSLPSFFTGAMLSLINPMHIPFWLGWSTVLMNKGILTAQSKQYNFYITGIAIGTLAGFIVFISGGVFILKVFQSNQYMVNCIIGFVLFVTALFHIRKMIIMPVAIRHARLFKQS